MSFTDEADYCHFGQRKSRPSYGYAPGEIAHGRLFRVRFCSRNCNAGCQSCHFRQQKSRPRPIRNVDGFLCVHSRCANCSPLIVSAKLTNQVRQNWPCPQPHKMPKPIWSLSSNSRRLSRCARSRTLCHTTHSNTAGACSLAFATTVRHHRNHPPEDVADLAMLKMLH